MTDPVSPDPTPPAPVPDGPNDSVWTRSVTRGMIATTILLALDVGLSFYVGKPWSSETIALAVRTNVSGWLIAFGLNAVAPVRTPS